MILPVTTYGSMLEAGPTVGRTTGSPTVHDNHTTANNERVDVQPSLLESCQVARGVASHRVVPSRLSVRSYL